jgi:hypothetical protein
MAQQLSRHGIVPELDSDAEVLDASIFKVHFDTN